VIVLVFIKLGGSLITDKRVENSFREAVVIRLAEEIRTALSVKPELKILVGHGSGSFGHFAASRFKTVEGVHSQEEWRAFAHVATVAAELNARVARVFDEAGLSVWRIQPSASALSRDSEILQLSALPIRAALEKNLIPLVYGDVALDEVRGGTIISTEKIFFYLAHHLPVSRILLLGEVEGVYDTEGKIVSEITPANYSHIQSALGGSAGTDVTGGMETKVSDMLKLVHSKSDLSIRIFDGTKSDLLKQTLLDESAPGTLIHGGSH
jgi:isopentenyl phosphate kinase